MNAIFQAQSQPLELVEIIDLKWLLAREGHRVHVERLQSDPAYALEVLALAAGSPSAALQAAAVRLAARLAAANKG
jgi:hypothetical protein